MSDEIKTYLAQIKARLAAATPGPWQPRYESECIDNYNGYCAWALGPVVKEAPNKDPVDQACLDAHFIAHARTDVVKLLAAVEVLLEANDYYCIEQIYAEGHPIDHECFRARDAKDKVMEILKT